MISLPIFRGAVSNAADVPSLDLNFSGPSGFFAAKGATPTLTRGSVATYTDSAGVLRTTNSNILQYSNGFNTAPWTVNNTTITATATISPDQSLNAFELKDTVANTSHSFYQIPTGTAAGSYTFSIYAKKSGKRYMGVAYSGILAGVSVFDTELGVFTQTHASHTVSATPAGNGWFRFIITTQTASAGGGIGLTIFLSPTSTGVVGLPVYTGDGTGIYIYGAQMEEASYAGPYSPTTTVATNNGPRIDYDPVTLACKGLLIEEFRSNSTPGSNDFSNATYWSLTQATITSNATMSPQGIVNAYEFKDTTSNTFHFIGSSSTINIVNGSYYTFSFYAKKSGKRYCSANFAGTFFGVEDHVVFDLELGIITQKSTTNVASITPVGNGWYRCSNTVQAISSGTSFPSGLVCLSNAATFSGRSNVYIGDGTGIYIYGAQLEVGTFPTSYIPTTTAAGNRGTENCYITGTNFSSWFNGTEGTFVVDFRVGVVSPSFTTILVASDGGVLTNNIRYTHQNSLNVDVWSGSSVIAQSPAPSYSIDTLYKSAIAYKANDFAFCLDSGTVTTDTSGAVPTGINQLVLAGGYVAGGGTSNTKITLSRVRYYNKRLANSRLQQRTSPTTLDWRSVGPVHWPNYKASIENSAIGATALTTYTNGPAHGRGLNAFASGVLAPNGKVILVPRNSTNIGIYDPIANTYTDGPTHGVGTVAFTGGVLLPNGKIIFDPLSSSTIGIYDPVANTYTNGPTHGKGTFAFAGSILTPNGKVILIPYSSLNIGIYDPITNTYTNGPLHGRGVSAFVGGVLIPDGRVILIPNVSTNIGIYDPIANTYTDGPVHGRGTSAFIGGVLTSTNKIILPPQNSTNVGIYDFIANTYTNGPLHGKGSGAFIGGSLTPDRKIILAPFGSLNVGIYDAVANTYTDGPVHNRGTNAFHGSISIPNGKVILIPFDSTNIGIFEGGTVSFNNNVLLSAYYNKL